MSGNASCRFASAQLHYPIINTSQEQKRLDAFRFPTCALSFSVLEVLIGCYYVSLHLQPKLAQCLISMGT